MTYENDAWTLISKAAADRCCSPVICILDGPSDAVGLLGQRATIALTDGSFLFDPAPLLAVTWQESSKRVVLQIGWNASSLMISLSFPVTVIVLRPLP